MAISTWADVSGYWTTIDSSVQSAGPRKIFYYTVLAISQEHLFVSKIHNDFDGKERFEKLHEALKNGDDLGQMDSHELYCEFGILDVVKREALSNILIGPKQRWFGFEYEGGECHIDPITDGFRNTAIPKLLGEFVSGITPTERAEPQFKSMGTAVAAILFCMLLFAFFWMFRGLDYERSSDFVFKPTPRNIPIAIATAVDSSVGAMGVTAIFLIFVGIASWRIRRCFTHPKAVLVYTANSGTVIPAESPPPVPPN